MRPATAFVISLAALAGAPAWAQSPDAGTQAKTIPAKNPEEVVCVRQAEPGSRIPGPKECHTRAVWDQMSADARREAQDLQQRSGTLSTQKGG